MCDNKRKLKFRAWSKKRKAWIDSEQSHINLFDVDNSEFSKLLKLTVQQFTGLVDRYGNEIYEGDIVSYISYRSTRTGSVVFCGYYNGWAIKDAVGNQPLTSPAISFDSIKIVGNIFENEL